MRFSKAHPGAVTRYLWVGGVYGMSVRQLAALFAPYGNPTVVLPEECPPQQQQQQQQPASAAAAGTAATEQTPAVAAAPGAAGTAAAEGAPGSPTSQPLPYFHAFLAFEAEGDAAAAATAVPRNAAWEAAGGRKLVVNFAEVRRDKRPVPRPVFSSSSDLQVPGLVLLPDFVTEAEEAALLEALRGSAAAAATEATAGGGATAAEAATAVDWAGTSCSEPAAAVAAADGPTGSSCSAGGSSSGGAGPWEAMSRRRVQHFGYRFDYAARNVDLSEPLGALPPWAAELARRIGALPEVSQPLDQLTVNEYDPGVGLSPHVDTHSAFTGPIISLSLGSSAVMEMRRGEAARPLLLPRRSLLVMGGESRYAWQHYIPHRVADLVDGQLLPRGRRVSLTFRKVRGFPCDCAFPDCCDSQQANLPPTRISQLRDLHQHPPGDRTPHSLPTALTAEAATELQGGGTDGAGGSSGSGSGGSGGGDNSGSSSSIRIELEAGGSRIVRPAAELGRGVGSGGSGGAGGGDAGEKAHPGGHDGADARLAALEAEFVHKVYDAIAPHFSATRFAVWPRVRGFIESLPRGGVVADVGCGNGKYFGVRRDLAVLGSDISAGLAEVAALRLRPAGLPPSAAPPAADALVADALRLPYRPGSCDGVLCIAVLHHISSRRRRVRLLRQLLRVLRPAGGRALVTVWATDQEDPAKTIAKWTRIAAPDATGGPAGSGGDGSDAAGGGGGGGGEGVDYFVPWHLPFHRAETAKAARMAREAPGEGAGADGGGGGGDAGRRAGLPKIDSAKGAVVFQRYYHLFDQGELVGLVEQALAEGPEGEEETEEGDDERGSDGRGGRSTAPCGAVEEVFYDRSNWCIVFRRDA